MDDEDEGEEVEVDSGDEVERIDADDVNTLELGAVEDEILAVDEGLIDEDSGPLLVEDVLLSSDEVEVDDVLLDDVLVSAAGVLPLLTPSETLVLELALDVVEVVCGVGSTSPIRT